MRDSDDVGSQPVRSNHVPADGSVGEKEMNDIVQYDLHGNPIEEHPHSDIGRHRVFVTNGASNHSKGERQEDDFYATDPVAAEWLLKLEKIAGPIWEPCCGHGDLSKVFVEHGFDVKSTDLVDRGYGEGGVDFLSPEIKSWDGCIITNPPFKFAQEIIEKALQIVPDGKKVYMFLRLLFLEGMRRGEMFRRCPPKKNMGNLEAHNLCEERRFRKQHGRRPSLHLGGLGKRVQR